MRRLDQPDLADGTAALGPERPPAEDHVITADDGRRLAATTVEGTSADTVVVAGGVAIRRGFYRDFATWLAAQGPTVITFDYRDVGGSRTVPLRTSTARMADWGRRDIDAVLRHASARSGGRLLYVGHSAGGQLLGLAGSADRVDRIVTVASQNGYWRAASAPERYRLGVLWHLVFPTALWAAGYLPGRWLGLGNDLSPGIARDWIRWCRDPEYLFGDPEIDATSFRRVRAPIRAVRVADDPWATRSAVADLHRRYARCPVDHVAISPQRDDPIGHSGLFRASTGAAHWAGVADWLPGGR